MWNLLQTAGTGAATVSRVARLGVNLAGDRARQPAIRIELDARQTVVLETADAPAELRVLSGSIWITEDGVDRILEAGASITYPSRVRALVTSLSATTIAMPSDQGCTTCTTAR